MFGSTQSGATAYAKVGVETGVSTASPHSLIVMLFDGALVAVASAIHHMHAGETASKGKAISKAISIIDSGLRASLNKEAGGEIAANLDSLYEYMTRRLLTANLKNQPELLEEVQRLLKDLKSAWDAIGPAGNRSEVAAPAPAPASRAVAPQAAAYQSPKTYSSSLAKA